MQRPRNILIGLIFTLIVKVSFAQWSTDPTVNNPVCTLGDYQQNPKTASDGIYLLNAFADESVINVKVIKN